jgi:hypothetical protein
MPDQCPPFRGNPKISLLAQLFQAQSDHTIHKHLQLLRQQIRTEFESAVGNHHDYGQMLHLWMQLQKASGLSKQPVLEPRLGVHPHLNQHDRQLRRARLR